MWIMRGMKPVGGSDCIEMLPRLHHSFCRSEHFSSSEEVPTTCHLTQKSAALSNCNLTFSQTLPL